MSVINIKYGDVTVESIPQGYCNSVIGFLWAIGLSTNVIHSEMCPVYCDDCVSRRAIQDWCKKFAQSRERVVKKKRPGRSVVDE